MISLKLILLSICFWRGIFAFAYESIIPSRGRQLLKMLFPFSIIFPAIALRSTSHIPPDVSTGVLLNLMRICKENNFVLWYPFLGPLLLVFFPEVLGTLGAWATGYFKGIWAWGLVTEDMFLFWGFLWLFSEWIGSEFLAYVPEGTDCSYRAFGFSFRILWF